MGRLYSYVDLPLVCTFHLLVLVLRRSKVRMFGIMQDCTQISIHFYLDSDRAYLESWLTEISWLLERSCKRHTIVLYMNRVLDLDIRWI